MARTAGRARPTVLVIALLVIVAAGFRCAHLDYGGFSEDEVNKIAAVRAYQRGQWSANGEHPMLMKVAMWASTSAADAWNRAAAGHGVPSISPEAALRLPNALAGAAAVIPLFLLARSFFGDTVARWAAAFLATDVAVSGINRIGKEDSLLVLFLLLGAWCYEEARQRHLRDGVAPHGWYAASGAAFGLMLASKYMPYHLGLWWLFTAAAASETSAWLDGRKDQRPPSVQKASAWFYLALVLVFVAADPAILLPGTWRYVLGYIGGATITHHGAWFAGRLYMNMVDATPWGLPWDYYLAYLVTKTPIAVVAVWMVGFAELVRRRRERGAVFARVFLIFFLLPASLVAGKFARYLLPTLVVLDIVAALGVVRLIDVVGTRTGHRRVAAILLAVVVLGGPVAAQVEWTPHLSAYQNALGRRFFEPGGLSPNDELYDAGVREAVAWIARRALPHASIASDAPGVVAEYLRRSGRSDIDVRSLSMSGPGRPPAEAWVIAQDGHACFESRPLVEQLRRRQAPAFVFRVRGTVAVETYRLPW